jgi:hypothetical protein
MAFEYGLKDVRVYIFVVSRALTPKEAYVLISQV